MARARRPGAGRHAEPMSTRLFTASAESLAYLRMLAAELPAGERLELRWRHAAGGMRRRFLTAAEITDAAALVARLAPEADVYVGVAPRASTTHGGRASIRASRMAWVESDDPLTATLLDDFPHRPSLLIASGTPGHLQIYWRLARPLGLSALESLNRRLACALRGDPASCEAARILRPPGSLNHKHDPPVPVRLIAHEARCVHLPARLAAGLPADPQQPKLAAAARRRRQPSGRLDRKLLAIPAATYVQVLAGRLPAADGKVSCPFHRDRHPSLQLYPDGSFYCFGAGCRAGGSIYDFAGRLWGIEPRGAGFLQLRERLVATFEIAGAAR